MPRFRVQEGGEGDEEDILVGQGKARILRGLVRLAQLQAFALAIVALALLVALLK